MWRVSILFTILTLSCAVTAADEPATITHFKMKDGKVVDAIAYASFHEGDLKSFVVTSLEVKKLMLLSADVVSQSTERVPLEKLPELARKEVLRIRNADAAARAQAEADAKQNALIAAARAKEYQARKTLSEIETELSRAKQLRKDAEDFVKNVPIETARLDARYDAAKTELASGGYDPSPFRIGYGIPQGRRDYLSQVMMQAAEDKAKLEADKKEAELVVARAVLNAVELEKRANAAQKDLDAARENTKKILEKRAESAEKPDGEFIIGKAQGID